MTDKEQSYSRRKQLLGQLKCVNLMVQLKKKQTKTSQPLEVVYIKGCAFKMTRVWKVKSCFGVKQRLGRIKYTEFRHYRLK